MTYRIDSDVIWSNFKILDRETETMIAPLKETQWANLEKNYFDPELYANVLNRKHRLLWFLDDCDVLTRHEQFLKELEEHFKIDIYGKCGAKKCVDDCDEIWNSTYKFRLFMDGSPCMEQVPQQYIDHRYYDTVPIVMGSDNLKYFLPPKSYVDINEFEDVNSLARNLFISYHNLKNILIKFL